MNCEQAEFVRLEKHAALNPATAACGMYATQSEVNPLHWVNGAVEAAAFSCVLVHAMHAVDGIEVRSAAVAVAMSLGVSSASVDGVRSGQSIMEARVEVGVRVRESAAAVSAAQEERKRMECGTRSDTLLLRQGNKSTRSSDRAVPHG